MAYAALSYAHSRWRNTPASPTSGLLLAALRSAVKAPKLFAWLIRRLW